jgi:UDP-2,3-diacylglucosamine pyrophosphatase LpxH
MLVFLSDLHLTDGSSGQTIKPAAFKLFLDNLGKLATSVTPLNEIRLVLLGDVFDVIRSCKWLGGKVRPWDDRSPVQEQMVLSIVEGILGNNAQTLAHLRNIEAIARDCCVPFQIDYVIGNHDWLINRYPSAQAKVVQALGLAQKQPFASEFFEPQYKVIARHGDIYDPFNYTGDRDASSLGDAIVIELLDRYPDEVGRELDSLVQGQQITIDERKRIVERLKELDNLRPATEAPSWVLSVLGDTPNPDARKVIETTWRRCVDQFFKVPYVHDQDKPFWPDKVDLLQATFQLSSHLSKTVLERVTEWKSRFAFADPDKHYLYAAGEEPRIRSGEASYVLYGHTHNHVMVPIEHVRFSNGNIQDKVYFNTGTWRMTWNKASANRDFVGWHVLTYITIFHEKENGFYNFEVWNGALG